MTILIFQPVEGRMMISFMNSELEGKWKEMNVNKPDIYLQRLKRSKEMFRNFWVIEPRTYANTQEKYNLFNHNAFIVKDMNIFCDKL